MFRFKDRRQAGQLLAERLFKYAGAPETIVLGLPRGGVAVAYEVAVKLELPLDVFLVRKLGVPGYEELAMGAIASGGVRVLNQDVLRQIRISESAVEAVTRKEERELLRREEAYRGNRARLDVKALTAILIDDGLATGATMRAAVTALRKQEAKRIVVAVPAAAPETCDEFRAEVDEIVCAITPTPFHAVGIWYEDFSQTTDEEVQQLLKAARQVKKGGRKGDA
ncbi:MAG: phosphoribosyltransferase [Deltaproteobacteria bacterium]|nr:phosphoribosyltransferase [Deltaproteobacteria bacterium]